MLLVPMLFVTSLLLGVTSSMEVGEALGGLVPSEALVPESSQFLFVFCFNFDFAKLNLFCFVLSLLFIIVSCD